MIETEADEVMQFLSYLDTCVVCGSDLAPAMIKYISDLQKLRDRDLYFSIKQDFIDKHEDDFYHLKLSDITVLNALNLMQTW